MEVQTTINQRMRGEVMNKHTTAIIQNASNATITTIGIDLAKNLFVVHGADASGKPLLSCLCVF